MEVHYRIFKPAELWTLAKTDPSPAKNMVLKFRNKEHGRQSGFGIYALSYAHRDVGDCIIYLGKFAGKMSKDMSIDSAGDGDIRDRWFKHIGSATLLLAGLRMKSAKSFFKHQNKSKQFYKENQDFLTSFGNSILGLDNKHLKESIFKKDGNQLSDNRLGFAIQNLVETNFTSDSTVLDLAKVISRFSCHYWKIVDAPMRKSQAEPLLAGTKTNPGVEKILIARYREKLPMNDEFTPHNSTSEEFYHYDPHSLINTSSREFANFDHEVRSHIHSRFGPLFLGRSD